MHLNPHAKCRSSKFNLKLLKKKHGGHLKPGNTLNTMTNVSNADMAFHIGVQCLEKYTFNKVL